MKRTETARKKSIWKRRVAVCLAVLALLIAVVLLLRWGHQRFLKSMFPLKYSDIVTQEAKDNNLDPSMVYAVIKAESNFNPDAKSRAGAVGLMQLTPDTFDWLQKQSSSDLKYAGEDLYTPKVNIRYGCRFLKLLFRKYPDERTALCAYNAGIGTVNGWLKKREYSADGKTLQQIPYAETRSYVVLVERNRSQYKSIYHM